MNVTYTEPDGPVEDTMGCDAEYDPPVKQVTYQYHYCVRDWRNGKYEADLIHAVNADAAVERIKNRHPVEAIIVSLTLVSPCQCCKCK